MLGEKIRRWAGHWRSGGSSPARHGRLEMVDGTRVLVLKARQRKWAPARVLLKKNVRQWWTYSIWRGRGQLIRPGALVFGEIRCPGRLSRSWMSVTCRRWTPGQCRRLREEVRLANYFPSSFIAVASLSVARPQWWPVVSWAHS